MKVLRPTAAVTLLAIAGTVVGQASVGADVALPTTYRTWTHVKSTVVGPGHPKFADIGGFQHIYANADAMRGYRNRDFNDGAVIVLEWLKLEERNGVFVEGPLRQQDVMVRDIKRFPTTGGWGFRRFSAAGVEGARAIGSQQCYACHQKRGAGELVLSRYRE